MGDTLTGLTVVHANLYAAAIDMKDILEFYEDEDVVSISFNCDYQYEEEGHPRWKSIEPLDKDEITYIRLDYKNGETKDISVPFKDVSTSGSYCVNIKSKFYEHYNHLSIEWEKKTE